MKKSDVHRWIFLILLLFTAGLIFGFSAQNAESSTQISRGVMEQVTEHTSLHPQETGAEAVYTPKEEWVHWLFRKTAHFTLYCMLGFWLMLLVRSFRGLGWKQIVAVLALGAIYACSDEFHQHFVPGRDASVTDVLIDTAGVAFGLAVAVFADFIYRRYKQKRQVVCAEGENI